jgi:hypothetical protein
MDKPYATSSLDCMDYSFCFDVTNTLNGNVNHSRSSHIQPHKHNEFECLEYNSLVKSKDDDDLFYDRSDDFAAAKRSDATATDDYRYINENTTEIEKVKNKLSTIWNNVKYGNCSLLSPLSTLFGPCMGTQKKIKY